MVEKVLLCGLEQFGSKTQILCSLQLGLASASSLGFSLMAPDVVHDLDWTVAEHQSKTVVDVHFITYGVVVLSQRRFTSEPGPVLTKPALKEIQSWHLFFQAGLNLSWVLPVLELNWHLPGLAEEPSPCHGESTMLPSIRPVYIWTPKKSCLWLTHIMEECLVS